MDAATAAQRLQISRSQLYQLRHQWLSQGRQWPGRASGGNRRAAWPTAGRAFIAAFLATCRPLNFALIADELARRFDFHRARAAVAALVRHEFAHLVAPLPRGPKPRRRWPTAAIGELFQHDSSPHRWWPADAPQCLILTLDDHSRKAVGAGFVPADTTWDHFCEMRQVFEQHGLPQAMYTDGLSLFGHESTADRRDTHSQFQRALTALGVAHRVAPDAPAKGQVERRFGFLQNRLVSVLAYEKVSTYPHANALLPEQLAYDNEHAVCRTTGLTPNQAWELALKEQRSQLRPCAVAPLLDLHLGLHLRRRLNADHTVDFLGKAWPVSASARKTVSVVHHPGRKFWVIAEAVSPKNPVWPDILASHSLPP